MYCTPNFLERLSIENLSSCVADNGDTRGDDDTDNRGVKGEGSIGMDEPSF